MKKSFLLFALAIGLSVACSSCKKNWTCSCANGYSTTITNQTKSQATTTCNTYAGLSGTTCNI